MCGYRARRGDVAQRNARKFVTNSGRKNASGRRSQRSGQGLTVVARTIVDVLHDWFPFVVAVRKLVVIQPIRVKDRFDDGFILQHLSMVFSSSYLREVSTACSQTASLPRYPRLNVISSFDTSFAGDRKKQRSRTFVSGEFVDC